MDIFRTATGRDGLSEEEIRDALSLSLQGRNPKKVLIIPPDFTRLHSNAGFITDTYYRLFTDIGAEVWVLPALGTHAPMTPAQLDAMYPAVPKERVLVHDWRHGVTELGTVPADFVREVTEGLWTEPVTAEVNRLLTDPSFDLILSVGQVVPHEVIGMSNHSKNIFVGVGGSRMINSSHMIGAVYGMERMMGRDNTPVRRIFDWGCEHFLSSLPIVYVLTVTTAREGKICTEGLFIGEGRECLTQAVRRSLEVNVQYVAKPVRKCVVYLDPGEFHSTWLGNKAVYRTRMALADGAELLVLAPGVHTFGEDAECDRLIRKYGYRGRLHTLEQFRREENADLRANMSAAAHLIHGSSDGRFTVRYAVDGAFRREIESVGYASADVRELMKKYPPERMRDGFSDVDGEEIFFISNPALGLWIDRSRLAQ